MDWLLIGLILTLLVGAIWTFCNARLLQEERALHLRKPIHLWKYGHLRRIKRRAFFFNLAGTAFSFGAAFLTAVVIFL